MGLAGPFCAALSFCQDPVEVAPTAVGTEMVSVFFVKRFNVSSKTSFFALHSDTLDLKREVVFHLSVGVIGGFLFCLGCFCRMD